MAPYICTASIKQNMFAVFDSDAVNWACYICKFGSNKKKTWTVSFEIAKCEAGCGKTQSEKKRIQTRHSRDSEGWGGRAAFHTGKCLNLTHTHDWTLPHTCFLSFTHILYWNCDFASLFMWFVLYQMRGTYCSSSASRQEYQSNP